MKLNQLPSAGLLFLISCYKRFVSPHLGDRCRYVPFCSDYARESIIRFGFWKGSYLAITRVCRCHPYREGGYDPVPDDHQQ